MTSGGDQKGGAGDRGLGRHPISQPSGKRRKGGWGHADQEGIVLCGQPGQDKMLWFIDCNDSHLTRSRPKFGCCEIYTMWRSSPGPPLELIHLLLRQLPNLKHDHCVVLVSCQDVQVEGALQVQARCARHCRQAGRLGRVLGQLSGQPLSAGAWSGTPHPPL